MEPLAYEDDRMKHLNLLDLAEQIDAGVELEVEAMTFPLRDGKVRR